MHDLTPPSHTDSGSAESKTKLLKSIFIKDLKPKDNVQSSFLVKSKQMPVARNGKAYLSLYLMDRTGEMDSRVWDNVEELSQYFAEGDVVSVSAKVHAFQNRLQMIVQDLVTIPTAQIELKDYLPQSSENLERLYVELIQIFEKLENPWVRRLSLMLLKDPEISERFKICPAAKTIHHAFLGGLLVHSLNVIKLVDAVLPLYRDISRDIMIFGAAFHDFGKIFELDYKSNFGYTDEGRLVGHIAIGVNLIDRKIQKIEGFPKELEWQLKHILLSHHGKLEYGSPKRPHTIEAEILSQLDNLDSKIDSIQGFMKSENNNGRWTGHHRAYDQYYYKPNSYLKG